MCYGSARPAGRPLNAHLVNSLFREGVFEPLPHVQVNWLTLLIRFNEVGDVSAARPILRNLKIVTRPTPALVILKVVCCYPATDN